MFFSSPLSFHLPLSFPRGSDTQGLESDPKAGTFPGYTLVEPIEREFWALLKRGNSGLCSSAGNLGVAQECGNPGFCAADPCNSNELQGGAVPAGTPQSFVSPPSKQLRRVPRWIKPACQWFNDKSILLYSSRNTDASNCFQRIH